MTGDTARRHLVSESKKLKELSGLLKVTPQDSADRLAVILDERRKFERDLADARKRLAMGGGGSAASSDVIDLNGIKFMGRSVEGVEMKDLKGLADEAKVQLVSGIVALINIGEDGKAGLVVAVTADLTNRFNAVDLVRVGAEALGGKGGGGRPDMAQAGGPDGAQATAALEAIVSAVRAIG
jgi:alanyl-tRNA synthetase